MHESGRDAAVNGNPAKAVFAVECGPILPIAAALLILDEKINIFIVGGDNFFMKRKMLKNNVKKQDKDGQKPKQKYDKFIQQIEPDRLIKYRAYQSQLCFDVSVFC